MISLIDPKRSLNISIQLAGIRMPFKQIKRALLQMDDETLKVDQLNILALAVPTTEEISLLRGYPGDKAQLATVEQYFLQVMPIPRLGARIAALVFKGTAESNLRKVTEEYELVAAAALELVGYARFVTVLEGILAVGNHLNGGTYAVARGFRLETLLRLTDVKAVDRRLPRAARRDGGTRRARPRLFLAGLKLKSVARAAHCIWTARKETLDAVEKGLASVNVEVLRASGANPGSSRAESTEETHDRFGASWSRLPDFSTEKDVAARARGARGVGARRGGVDVVFGEPFKPDNAGRIFKLVADFLVTFDKVQDDARREAPGRRGRRARSLAAAALPRPKASGGQTARGRRRRTRETPDGSLARRTRRRRAPCARAGYHGRHAASAQGEGAAAWTPRRQPPARWRA